MLAACFHPVGHLEHDAGVSVILIPALGDIGNGPGVPLFRRNGLEILYIGVVGRLVAPGNGGRVPVTVDLVRLDVDGVVHTALEHGDSGVHNDIGRGELRQVAELHEDALLAVLCGPAALHHAPVVAVLQLFKDALVPDGAGVGHRLQHGVQYHGIGPAAVRHPFPGQQVIQVIAFRRFQQPHLHIVAVGLIFIHQEGSGHVVDRPGIFPGVRRIGQDGVILLQRKAQALAVQVIAVAQQSLVLLPDDDGLLQLLRRQVIFQVRVLIDRCIFHHRVHTLRPDLPLHGIPGGFCLHGIHCGLGISNLCGLNTLTPLQRQGLCHGIGQAADLRRAIRSGCIELRTGGALQGTGKTEGQTIPVLLHGDGLLGIHLGREGHIPGTGCVAVDGAAVLPLGTQGVVDLLPLAVLLIMDRRGVDRQHPLAVR